MAPFAYVQGFRDSLLAVTAKQRILDHLGEARIDLLKGFERLVHTQDVVLARR